jgi:tRNA(Ile)-lysidine synthase
VKKSLLERILKTIRRYDLLESGDRVLAAVSGGADSVFLLHALIELRDRFDLTLALAHLNHGIRGEEGDADENFVRSLALDLDLPFFSKKEPVEDFAVENRVGVEEAGRILRYAFLEETLRLWKGTRIATGHTRTDSCETIFLNLLRGSGPRGLSGIPTRRDAVIRPIIGLTREEIEGELRDLGIRYKVDKTNLTVSYRRNYLRNVVFPGLEREFPGFSDRVTRTGEMLREENDFLQGFVRRELQKVRKRSPEGEVILDRVRLLSYHSSVRRWMAHLLLDLGYEQSRAFDRLLMRGGRLSLRDRWKVEVSEGDVRIYRKDRRWRGIRELGEGATLEIPSLNLEIRASRVRRRRTGDPLRVFIPLSMVSTPLTVRTRRRGDSIEIPRVGRKSLKKLFIDRKVPRWRRVLIPLVLSGDTILWVISVDTGFEERTETNGFLKLEVKRHDDRKFWVFDP